MLSGLSWLALEVKDVAVGSEFYGGTLSMRSLDDDALPGSLARTSEQVAYAAGDTAVVLRRPTDVPRGGLHTHYAMSIPSDEYDDWWDHLEGAGFELDEHQFGSARSLYCYDPDGNCVELGEQSVEGPGIDGVFEVVLEVEALDRAEAFYAALGFETVDRGADRKRVRTNGPMALELWEPHLGLADARGGVHVDLGFATNDPKGAVDAVADRVTDRERLDDPTGDGTGGDGSGGDGDGSGGDGDGSGGDGDGSGGDGDAVRVRDPDGHCLTFHEP